MKKVIKDGKVAVLYSPGYGAGWYSWNQKCRELLFDPKLVELVLDENKKVCKIIKRAEELLPDGYFGGADQLKVKWVEKGSRIEITEYDGNESVRIFEPNDGILV